MSHSCSVQFPLEWMVGEFDEACVCTSSLHEGEVEMEGNIIVALKCFLLLGYSKYFIHLSIIICINCKLCFYCV
jgi:hypothetical protein